MTDLTHHYKEISPEQTVQNVKDFFTSKNFRIEESDTNQSEAGTWYCHVDLYSDKMFVLGANGKGMTKEYGLASGYAELYERFCNAMTFAGNFYYEQTLQKMNYEKHGYYLDPNEKDLTYEEVIHGLPISEYWMNQMADHNPQIEKAIVDIVTNKHPIGVPFKNIADENDIIYLDPRYMLRVSRSNGMAAGNTIIEALNQGISELCERSVESKVFRNWEQTHYALNLDNIKNKNLQDIIHNLKTLGYDLYLIDLSYTYEMPVMMSLLVDRINGILNINFGSFPVFDIAAERVLTELYQGVATYRTEERRSRLQIPFKSQSTQELQRLYGNSISGDIFPQVFFDMLQFKDTYNTEIFVDQNVTNEELNQYYIELGKKHGFKWYYRDNSLCDSIKAIYITPDIDFGNNETDKIKWNNDLFVFNTIEVLKLYTTIYQHIYEGTAKPTELLQLAHYLFSCPQDIMPFYGWVLLWNNYGLGNGEGGEFSNLVGYLRQLLEPDMMNGPMNNNQDILTHVPQFHSKYPFFHPTKKYLQLLKYINVGKYSIDELYIILNQTFNYNITNIDIKNIYNIAYLIEHIYIEPLQEAIKSNAFLNFINAYIK